jgi:hypothetical protein
MPGDRSREHRRLATECLTLARQTSDAKIRASLLEMAQRWLTLAELAEQDAYTLSLRRRAILAAIGEELKTLYRMSHCIPPHLLALLAQLKAASEKNGEEG